MFPPLDCKSAERSSVYFYNSINSTQVLSIEDIQKRLLKKWINFLPRVELGFK